MRSTKTARGPICSIAEQREGVADENFLRRFDLWSQDVRHAEISDRRANSSVESVSARPKIRTKKSTVLPPKLQMLQPLGRGIFSYRYTHSIVSQLPLPLFLHRGLVLRGEDRCQLLDFTSTQSCHPSTPPAPS
jgi:hypothetical protein